MADDETAVINTAINHEEQNIFLSDDDYESDYDAIWKDFIAEFWKDILKRFMPDLYDKANLKREPENLDKELRDLLPEEPKAPARYVDTLMKIFLKDGGEEWVLLHVEIQGRGRENISRRMFRYYCLIFTHHDVNPAALAILTSRRPKAEGEPGIYNANVFGTKIEYKYNVIKAYELDDEELKAGNIVDLFVYSAKIAAKYRKSNKKKLGYMKIIVQLLAKKGWEKFMRRRFIIYLERVMHLSSIEYRAEFKKTTDETFQEGGSRMRYKTVTEEIYEEGIAKGMSIISIAAGKGMKEGVAEAITQTMREGIAQGRHETARELINLGLLTDEQIASVTKHTVDAIKTMRLAIEASKKEAE